MARPGVRRGSLERRCDPSEYMDPMCAFDYGVRVPDMRKPFRLRRRSKIPHCAIVEFASPQTPTDGRERRRRRPSVGLRLARASHPIGPRRRSRHPRRTTFWRPCHPRRCRRDDHRQLTPHAAGLRPTRAASGRGPEHGSTAGFGGGRHVAIPRWRAPPSARRPAESARSSLHRCSAVPAPGMR